MKIILPFPDMSLSPNRSKGHHWSKTHKAKIQAKKTAYFETLNELKGKQIDSVKMLSIVFYEPNKRRRDVDNMFASMKPSFDGISEAIKIDDSHFKTWIIDRQVDTKNPRVEINIT